ncbi:MAG: hypothetical protein K8S94_00435 [Planctomycetia bacterium]|nr:hypothetical protein [Planctomycetia bacterium]
MTAERRETRTDTAAAATVHDLPARDLAGLWNVLDVLPRASSSIDMAATTVDMVAVAAAAPPRGTGSRSRWLLPVVAVGVSLVAGAIAGRMTAADPDGRVLEYLPLIRHLETLQEAGTTNFLKSLADRPLPQPLRLPPDTAREEMREFDETLRDLEADHVWGSAARTLLTDRRAAIDTLTADERDALERAAVAFQQLSTAARRDLAAVAAVLAEPKRQDLRDAARAWHLLIAASDPPDRRNIVALDEKSRLEWIDRRSRLRDWDRGDRRGPPPPSEGGPPRPPGPGGPPGEGRPRWQGPRGERGGPRPGELRPGDSRPGGPRPNEPPRDGLPPNPSIEQPHDG